MNSIMIVLIPVLLVIVLFFLLRRLNLWYFRIDDAMTKMDKQIELLEQINNLLSKGNTIIKNNDSQTTSDGSNNVYDKGYYTKKNDVYILRNGDKYEIRSHGDYFYFDFANKQYFYLNLISAENSIKEIAKGNQPSENNLVSIKPI